MSYVVPADVCRIRIEAIGASGGESGTAGTPGAGARATSSFAVRPGETLFVRVGGMGGASRRADAGGRRLERRRRRRQSLRPKRRTSADRPARAVAEPPTFAAEVTLSSTASSSPAEAPAAPAAGSAARSARRGGDGGDLAGERRPRGPWVCEPGNWGQGRNPDQRAAPRHERPPTSRSPQLPARSESEATAPQAVSAAAAAAAEASTAAAAAGPPTAQSAAARAAAAPDTARRTRPSEPASGAATATDEQPSATTPTPTHAAPPCQLPGRRRLSQGSGPGVIRQRLAQPTDADAWGD